MYYLSNICSLCLVSNKNLQNISSQDNDGIVVEDKLKLFLLELVNLKPNIQKYICKNCLENLNHVYKFRQKCLVNMATLNEYLNKLLENGSYDNLSMKLPQQEHQINDNSESNLCENIIRKKCLQNSIDNDVTVDFNQTNIIPEIVIKKEIEENLENEDLPSSSNDHVQENLLENVKVEIENENTINSKTPYQFLSVFIEENHAEVVNNTTCIENAEKKQNTGNDKQYKCSECHEQFHTVFLLERHSRMHTEDRPFNCPYCSKRFKLAQHLARHKRIHTGEKPYECDVCHKFFTDLGNLTTHKRTHTGEKPFQCRLCQYKCSQSSTLRQHLRMHTGERPYKCDVCNKTFSVVSHLTNHKRTHTGEKPHHCQLCAFKCTKKNSLQRHMMTHTGEKPFQCSYCEYKCAQSNNLKKHMQRCVK